MSDDPRFLSRFLHDLRQPLRGISVITQLLQTREDLPPDVAENIDRILRLVDVQEKLIAGVSELDQAANPGMTLDPWIPLHAAILGAVSRVPHEGVLLLPDQVPDGVVRSGLSKVLEKVLQNAFKFQNAAAEPRVEVQVEVSDSGRGSVRVQDNGLGIPEKYKTAVFDPFCRLHPQSEFPGSGLGLSIAQRLLHSIGGEIFIGDPPEHGTVVVIEFPVRLA